MYQDGESLVFQRDRVYCWEMSSSFTVKLGKSSVVQHVILQKLWHTSTIIEYREKMTVGHEEVEKGCGKQLATVERE